MKPTGIRIIPKQAKQPEPPMAPVVMAPPPPAPTTTSGFSIKKKPGFTGKNANVVRNEYIKFREAKDDVEDEYDNLFVFPYRDEMKVQQSEILRIYIKGRPLEAADDNAFFPGRYLKCRIEFRENYPEDPPKFFIEKLKNGKAFQSMNVYTDGEVCQYTLNKQYWDKKKYDLCTILKSVEGMLYAPNSSDPANLIMQEMFMNDEDQYWRAQAEQAQYFYTEKDIQE